MRYLIKSLEQFLAQSKQPINVDCYLHKDTMPGIIFTEAHIKYLVNVSIYHTATQ